MLGVPQGQKPTILSRLAAQPAFHKAIRTLRLLDIASVALSLRPVRRTLHKSGTRYRVRFAESLLMADEIFKREIYREAFQGADIKTYIDLGSNVGYFPCFAADYTGRRDLVGLSVDAHPQMAAETQWHIDENAWPNVKRVHGVVGFDSAVAEATFYINPSNISCSAQPVLNPDVPAKGEPKPTIVRTVHLAKEWRAHAGERRVDLLKMDVEGFEREVLSTISDVLAITERVVLEWHKWINPRESIDAIMIAQGFELARVISEDPHCGVALYTRTG
jgi:FkbM family methyltransferase